MWKTTFCTVIFISLKQGTKLEIPLTTTRIARNKILKINRLN